MTAISVRLWTPGVTYRTSDGRTLLKSDVVTEFHFEIAFAPDLNDPNATTFDSVVKTTCRLADNRGNVWQLVSHWSTTMLVKAMMDLFPAPLIAMKTNQSGQPQDSVIVT